MDMPRDVSRSRCAFFVLVAAIGCAADLATKEWLFSWPQLQPNGGVWWIWKDHVGFQLSLNEGALFGMGQGFVWVFAALSIMANAPAAARPARTERRLVGCIMRPPPMDFPVEYRPARYAASLIER